MMSNEREAILFYAVWAWVAAVVLAVFMFALDSLAVWGGGSLAVALIHGGLLAWRNPENRMRLLTAGLLFSLFQAALMILGAFIVVYVFWHSLEALQTAFRVEMKNEYK